MRRNSSASNSDAVRVNDRAYRPDGTLAHSKYRFAAFMFGGCVLEQETAYDEKGRKLFDTAKCVDLNGKPKTADIAQQMRGMRPEIKDYVRAAQLPFAK